MPSACPKYIKRVSNDRDSLARTLTSDSGARCIIREGRSAEGFAFSTPLGPDACPGESTEAVFMDLGFELQPALWD